MIQLGETATLFKPLEDNDSFDRPVGTIDILWKAVAIL